jgi:hypothetical protein
MTKSREQEQQSDIEEADLEVMDSELLEATAVVFRNPVPGGPESATEGIARQDGGWLFTDPETQVRMWVPDSNVIVVKLRLS